jgi:hypothetical protein
MTKSSTYHIYFGSLFLCWAHCELQLFSVSAGHCLELRIYWSWLYCSHGSWAAWIFCYMRTNSNSCVRWGWCNRLWIASFFLLSRMNLLQGFLAGPLFIGLLWMSKCDLFDALSTWVILVSLLVQEFTKTVVCHFMGGFWIPWTSWCEGI